MTTGLVADFARTEVCLCIIQLPVCPVSAIFALDDLPEKWHSYMEKNSSYVEGGKFQPDKHKTA